MQNSMKDLNYETLRSEMVYGQLLTRDVDDERVLSAMSRVERERFVPSDLVHLAYCDRPLPIECGQTISQPYTVGIMAQAARLNSQSRVLEIGTGSGYGAAVLSLLAEEVHTVELIPELAESAAERLESLGYNNVHVHQGDGHFGLPAYQPYDAIVVTAGVRKLPESYVPQLGFGGRVVIPIGRRPLRKRLYRFVLCDTDLKCADLGAFDFVPLVSGSGGKPEQD